MPELVLAPFAAAASRRLAALHRLLMTSTARPARDVIADDNRACSVAVTGTSSPAHMMFDGDPFVAKPYLQLSTASASPDGTEQVTLVWHTLAGKEESGGWLVRWEDSTLLERGRMRRSSGKLRPKVSLR